MLVLDSLVCCLLSNSLKKILNFAVWKLFVLDKNTWNHVTVCKQVITIKKE